MPEETDKYIRIPVRNCEVTATIDISETKGIKALYCGRIKKVRTYLFAKSKGWTMEKAKAWIKTHDDGKELVMDYAQYGWKKFTDTRRDPDTIYLKSHNLFTDGKKPVKVLELNKKELEKIMPYLGNPKEVDPSKIAIFKADLANNYVDRTMDRFHENYLRTLAKTLPGKGFLLKHDWSGPGFGVIYDAKVIDTGVKLPIGNNISIIWKNLEISVYMRNEGSTIDGVSNEEILKNINYGIAKFVSVGFRALQYNKVTDKDEKTLFYEIGENGKGEGLEGSLVWLGAQYDAAVTQEMSKGFMMSISADDHKKIFGDGDSDILQKLITKEILPEMNEDKKKELEKVLGQEIGDEVPEELPKESPIPERKMETKPDAKMENNTFLVNMGNDEILSELKKLKELAQEKAEKQKEPENDDEKTPQQFQEQIDQLVEENKQFRSLVGAQLKDLRKLIMDITPDPKSVVGEREETSTERKTSKEEKKASTKNDEYTKELGKTLGRENAMVWDSDQDVIDFGT
jgi:hypothetical protein